MLVSICSNVKKHEKSIIIDNWTTILSDKHTCPHSTQQTDQQNSSACNSRDRVTTGALLMFHLLTYLMTMSKRP